MPKHFYIYQLIREYFEHFNLSREAWLKKNNNRIYFSKHAYSFSQCEGRTSVLRYITTLRHKSLLQRARHRTRGEIKIKMPEWVTRTYNPSSDKERCPWPVPMSTEGNTVAHTSKFDCQGSCTHQPQTPPAVLFFISQSLVLVSSRGKAWLTAWGRLMSWHL